MRRSLPIVAGIVALGALILAWILLHPTHRSKAVSTAGLVPSTQSPLHATPRGAPQPWPRVEAREQLDPDLPGGMCDGQVVSADNGRGVPSAELLFVGAKGTAMTVHGDQEGRFVFRPSEPGMFQLATIAAEGYLSYAPLWGRSALDVRLTAGGRVSGIMLVLHPAVELADVGIGMHPRGDALVVQEVYPGGAAEEAGIREGFMILAVDSVPVRTLGTMGTIHAIRGPEGTTVSLTVRTLDGQEGEMVIRRRLIRP